jgi:hypothetical protein
MMKTGTVSLFGPDCDSTTNNSAGQVEKTNDRDFETELRRYRTMETAATKLQKEAKGYLDSLRGMNSPSHAHTYGD